MDKLANDITNKLVLDVEDIEIVDPNLKATYDNLPAVQYAYISIFII